LGALWLALAICGLAQAQPLAFNQALDLALNSPSLEIARLQAELAHQQLAVAASPIGAELTAGYSATWGVREAPGLLEPRSLDDRSWDPFALTTAFNVVPFGPRFDRLQRARFNLLRSEQALRDERARLLLETTRHYLSALRATEQAALAERQLALAQDTLAATQARQEAGAVTAAQLLQSEIAVSRAHSQVADAARAKAAALALLSLSVGTTVTAVAGEPPIAAAPPTGELGQLAERSDILAARLALAEAELTASSTLRDNLPTGSLSLSYARQQGERRLALGAGFDTRSFQPSLSLSFDPDAVAGNSPDATSSSFRLGLSARVPLDAALPAALQAAALAVEQASLQLTLAIHRAELEVNTRQREVEAAETALGLSEQLLAHSRLVAQDTEARYALGLVSSLERDQAELSAAEAELAAARARDGVLLARLALAAALALDPLEIF
jgi:outer membrane protein TolC